MQIYNYHVQHTPNVGDRHSPPMLYIRQGVLADLGEATSHTFGRGDLVIIGGGGLLMGGAVSCFPEQLAYLTHRPRDYAVVVWGAGHNSSADEGVYPDWLDRVDLVGVRDLRPGYRWVPCASCFSAAFDCAIWDENAGAPGSGPQYPLAIYDHGNHAVPCCTDADAEIPRASNYSFTRMSDAIAWLARAETIVTSSYHGAYWATLLGRRVIAYDFSSKFRQMRHPPRLVVRDEDWHDALDQARSYTGALDECRRANAAFWREVTRTRGGIGEHQQQYRLVRSYMEPVDRLQPGQ